MKNVTVSAPGKVILMGEHAVVYGKPALISAINLRLTASVCDSAKTHIVAEEGEGYIRHIVGVVMEHFKIEHPPALRIEIRSDIPSGYHLGSSAALSVALVGALSYHVKKIWNPALINQLAYKSENYVHKNSSGVDPAAVVSGGLIWYRKELDFLRSIWQFPFGIPNALHHFYLIDTGRPKETTGDMVSFVEKKHVSQSVFDENERQTKNIAIAIKEENEQNLIEAMRAGEKTLELMGVVSEKALSIVRSIEKTGGAAKILGGGGKTAGVGYLLSYTKTPGKLFIPITLGEEGVKLELS